MDHNEYISEGYAIGFEYTDADIRKEMGETTTLDAMLAYHELSEHDYERLSNNEQRRLWENFKLLGNEVSTEYQTKVDSMKARYANNKKAKIGSSIKCAGCGKAIKKKSYQTQFCRNKGSGNCKDKYHNNTNVQRRKRAQFISANR